MNSAGWRSRLTYAAMSFFVAWHTLAIVVAPAPDSSEIAQALHAVLDPYLNVFRINNGWAFFAPEVGKGQQFRYVVEDAAGQSHTFVPTDELSWYNPRTIWLRIWYDGVLESPDTYVDSTGALLCQKHAALRPVAVTLLLVEEQDFSPADYLSDKHPLDPEFIAVHTVKRVKCEDN